MKFSIAEAVVRVWILEWLCYEYENVSPETPHYPVVTSSGRSNEDAAVVRLSVGAPPSREGIRGKGNLVEFRCHC